MSQCAFLLRWFFSCRLVAPLGLHHCHVPSGLLRSCSSHLTAVRVQFGCINCQQGIDLTCLALRPATVFVQYNYIWMGWFHFQGFQARANCVNGHTGQLSSVSVLLSWAGSLGLAFVTLQVVLRTTPISHREG